MLARNGIGRHVELRRTEKPVRVSQRVQKPEVLEAPVRTVEAIPLRVLDTHAYLPVRIRAPTRRGDEQSIEEPAVVTVFGLQEKACIEYSGSDTVVQIATILVVVSIDAQPAITKFDTRDNRIISQRVSIAVAGS